MSIISKQFRYIILAGVAMCALLYVLTFDLSVTNLKKVGKTLLSSELVSWTVFSLNLWALTRIFDKKVPILSKMFDSTEDANKDAV
jgi:hypothetical protein